MKTKIIISLLILIMLSCNNYYYMEETLNEQGLVTDIDGNTYKTVKIGEQWWMAENLKTTRNVDGTIITKCRFFADDSVQYHHVGRLYNRDVIIEGRLCPDSWRIPSKEDVDILLDFLGDNAGGKLKAVGTFENGLSYWFSPNVGATNETGFTALPAGHMLGDKYKYYGRYALFWTNTVNTIQAENNPLIMFQVRNDMDTVFLNGYGNERFYASVRCIKN